VRNENGPQGAFCLGAMSVPTPTNTDRTALELKTPTPRRLFFSTTSPYLFSALFTSNKLITFIISSFILFTNNNMKQIMSLI